MDMKKKLEDAYMPDKSSRKERVVVGLSGGYDSFVAAYLLKIQKYDILAVTIAVGWDSFSGSKSETLSCHLDEAKLGQIKDFCQSLNIPHFLVKSTTEFQENVVEEWLSTRALGLESKACWYCHDLRIILLHEKMLELEASSFATGHYAKLFHHETHGTYYVHTSNDEENDQSAQLARLPKEVLSHLKLPLSDLQKKEVIKLAENFGLSLDEKVLKMHECFPHQDSTVEYLQKMLPKQMAKAGDFKSLKNPNEDYGPHEGIIHYRFGQAIDVQASGKRDRLYIAQYSSKDHRILLTGKEHFKRDKIFLMDCHLSEETPWVEPMRGVIELSDRQFLDCWIYPKALSCAYVEWEGEHLVIEGSLLTIYRKRGRNSKIYLSGKAKYVQAAPVENKEEGEQNGTVKVDHTRDF